MSAPLAAFLGLLFLLLVAAVAITGAGQTYQGLTKDVSVQVCDDFGCRWEIQTVLK